MAKKYQHLLSPLKIGNVVIKNRTLFPNASPHFLQGPETFPAESLRAFYANIAKNGCAIITLAEWSNPNQRKGPYYSDGTHMQNFDYTDPSVGNYFSQLADEIHFYGS
jgi:2,4-dienoyl-CoA reductase-like NADH-dependent reductase (Old Yellow Enzyme family)